MNKSQSFICFSVCETESLARSLPVFYYSWEHQWVLHKQLLKTCACPGRVTAPGQKLQKERRDTKLKEVVRVWRQESNNCKLSSTKHDEWGTPHLDWEHGDALWAVDVVPDADVSPVLGDHHVAARHPLDIRAEAQHRGLHARLYVVEMELRRKEEVEICWRLTPRSCFCPGDTCNSSLI